MSQPKIADGRPSATSDVDRINEKVRREDFAQVTKFDENQGQDSRALSKEEESENDEKDQAPVERWSLGILNDTRTEEVPGMYPSPVRYIGKWLTSSIQAPFFSSRKKETSRWV